MKISILLPYKENYSINSAGAVSLFVKDTTSISKFKNKIRIFGSTKDKLYLSKNYTNLKTTVSFFRSSNKEYVKRFLIHKDFLNTDLLEVHNRPKYITQIKKSYNKRLFLYFHNDPQTMSGSKNLTERKYLISVVDKILFNSEWSRKRFFQGFDNRELFLHKTVICYQSTNRVKIDFTKKQKIISYVGKLNKAKGYDIFGNVAIKILNKFKDWRVYVIGNEPREKINFEHKNYFNLGFKDNKYVLNFLKKTSISVIPSRWDEPFGRASLEASSRGSAVIISSNGGLPETSEAAIVLKKLDEKNLYKEIFNLISNVNKLKYHQRNNYKKFFLEHKYVTKIIDELRFDHKINMINLSINKTLRIIHITNFNYRFDGRLQYNTGRRINNGFVRLGHNVLTISDRDLINQNKNILDPTGKNTLQSKIIKSIENFKPDIIVIGHADSVSRTTLNIIKEKNIKICQWFLDPVTKHGPDYINNKKRFLEKSELIDASFLTTDPLALDFNIKNCFFIPNPCDKSFETLKNYNKDCDNDLFFAMSHGVHRGDLKKGKFDNRESFINKLIRNNRDIKFDIYGMNNSQPIWGTKFVEKISNSSMGLNLSRGKAVKYYSSDRIAQLAGNGLLTFIDEKTNFRNLFNDKQMIFYKNFDDLSEKLNKYKKDSITRKRIAKNGRDHYFKHFNSTQVAKYILSKTFNLSSKTNSYWENK
jgi:glycosyltransferase involved in cell wall biosynthesis